jgi:hypothetical protein
MKRIVDAFMQTVAGLSLAVLIAACATTGGTVTPASQLTMWCPTAQSEISAFESVSAQLTPTANQALAVAAPLVVTMCSPTAIAAATSGDVATFTAQVLPALTVIAVEYAALQAKPAAGMKAPEPIMGVL